ncbi:MAG: DUF1080 domain-containing protein [Aquificae bacterium]|nr:DUF1080 domain-containing protein [Aquificota bacterium]
MFKRWLSRGILFLLMAVIGGYIAGCGAGVSTTSIQTTEKDFNETVKYEGPKARIAVANFKCKAAKCGGRIGSGIRDMLVDALVRTGKFIVVERGEGLEEIKKELELGQSGLVQPGKAPQPGQLEGADILVVGSIVAFEPNAGGIKGGLGGLIPKVPLLGGVKLGKEEAYIALTLRFIDVRTGRIINSTRVEGKASSFNIGGLGGGLLGTIPLGGGLDIYKNTPMEKAVMVLIDNAVKAIEKYVPESYYRYNAQGQPTTRPTSIKTQTTAKTQGSTQAAVTSQQSEQVKGKVVFSDNFEKYGVGQTPPFGRWEGNKDAAIRQVVQINGQIGKAVQFNGGKICITNLKIKDFIMELDFTHKGNIEIIFRVQKNPYIAYLLHIDADDNLHLYKVAGNMKVKMAENKGKFNLINKWSHLKLVVDNSSIKALANGKDVVIDINDTDASLNKEGFICISGGSWYKKPLVDNVIIYEINKK